MILRRICAFLIDWLVFSVWLVIVAIVSSLIQSTGLLDLARLFGSWPRAQVLGLIIVTIPLYIYFVVMETRSGATIGKRVTGLRVEDLSGQTPPLKKSLLRNLVKLLPWELGHAGTWIVALTGEQIGMVISILAQVLVLGWIATALVTKGKSSLWDKVAGTMIVDTRPVD